MNADQLRMIAAQRHHAETIIQWMRRELGTDDSGGGFYHNRQIIRKAARASQVNCLMKGRYILGFVVFGVHETRGKIDIMEIRPRERGKGYGRMLAELVLQMMASRSVRTVRLECCPHSSEAFWRLMGFRDDPGDYSWSRNPHLMLDLPAAGIAAPLPDAAAPAASQSSAPPDH